MNDVKLLQGDALRWLKMLPDNSVSMICTSPPYFQQRDYHVDGQIGLEQTLGEFIQKLVAIFAEARRVLHPQGVLWLNIGDSYAGGGRGGGGSFAEERPGWIESRPSGGKGFRSLQDGCKRKDLMGIPWTLALAMRAEGWYLRADCIWNKNNAMPSSVEDRPGLCHEYVFMFSKSEKYFYDQEAVRRRTGNESSWRDYIDNNVGSYHDHGDDAAKGLQQKKVSGFKSMTHPEGAKLRTVWTIPTTHGPEGHYASFPLDLAELCIKAGSSERGICFRCKAPFVRIMEDFGEIEAGGERKRANAPGAVLSETSALRTGKIKISRPVGWKQGCKCGKGRLDPVPALILDPFSGTGTTGLAATRLGRNYTGIELKQEYLEMSRARIYEDRPLFNRVEVY